MHKVARYVVILLIIMQTLIVSTLPVLKAIALQKGVITGDYFNYGNFTVWISDPSVLETTYLFDSWKKFLNLKEIDFRIVPPTANPSLIYFNQTISFTTNDTVKELSGAVDISSGDSQGAQGSLFFVSAGLGKGDRIYVGSANFTFTINETRTDPYWSKREVCLFNMTSIDTKDNMRLLVRTIIKWDRLTGALLSVYETKGGSVGSTVIVEGYVVYELVATNRFRIEHSGGTDMTLIYIAVIAILIAVFAVLIVKMSTTTPKKKWARLKTNK